MTLITPYIPEQDYPSAWPKANPDRPKALSSRVTEAQKYALYHRLVTTRDLAKQLGVEETYLSRLFPGKTETISKGKQILTATRREFRKGLASEVISRSKTVKEAAKLANTSCRTMARVVKALRESKS